MVIAIIFLLASFITVVFLLVFLFSNIFSSILGAPFVPIKKRHVKFFLYWAGLSADDIFYDLGCGDGRLLVSAVKDFGVKKAIGYELAPWPYLKARFIIWWRGLNEISSIKNENFFKTDLKDASFIYAYLFPKLVDRLAFKMAGELRSGAKILCPSFPIDLIKHPKFKLLKTHKIDKIDAYLYEKI
ncbi:MAG: hypothetical protein AAB784_00725 [Patescibacteria group bacterium]